MIKTTLLATVLLATLALESQARPKSRDVLAFVGGVAVGSALSNPAPRYVEQPMYYQVDPPPVYCYPPPPSRYTTYPQTRMAYDCYGVPYVVYLR